MSPPAPSAPRLQDASALPVGTRLGEFELLSLLGVGGFGIVYLAFDHALEREVAVKEYMPASLAGRTETMHVSLRSQSDAETFALGLRSFVNEARLLARFDHPSLLKVLRFWEANGTAYMAMPVMRGRTLKELRTTEGRAPDEATLRSMVADLLGALERLHGEGVYHRDIAPDNIQIEPDGHPVLLDFGAARRVLSDKTQTLTAILKPAYAPIEQYAETGAVKQGPWTDFYALGATLHYVLLGKPPAPATARAVFDESAALAGTGLPGYSPAFLQMVDWMLAPKPADRPQNVADLRQVLLGERPVPTPFMVEPTSAAWDKTQILPHGLTGGDDATRVMPRAALSAIDGATASVTGARHLTAPPQPRAAAAPSGSAASAPDHATASKQPAASVPGPAPAPSAAVAATPAATRRSPMPWLAAAAAAVVAAAVVFWPKPATVPAASPAVAALPAATLPAAPAAAGLASAPALSTGVAAAPVVAGAAAVAAPTVATVPPAAPAAAPQVRAAPESEIKPAQPAVVRPTPKPNNAAPSSGSKPAQASTAGTAPSPSPASDAPGTQPSAAASPGPAAPAAAPAPTAGATAESASPAPKTAAADAPAQVAEGPEAKCGGRNPLSYFVCMERECLRSSMTAHPDCKNWRKAAKRD